VMRPNTGSTRRSINSAMRRAVNALFDRVVRANTRVFSKTEAAFPVLIGGGIVIGMAAGLLAARGVGLSFGHSAATVAVALMSALTLPAARVTIGTEYAAVRWASNGVYHYQIAAFTGAGIFVACMGWPAPASLDIVAVGLGTAQVFGRMGCLLAGCCHGRPHSWGIRYVADGASGAVRGHLIGVRLFPIQAFEALWLALLVAPGSILLLSVRSPADSITWYVISYGAARFLFEFGRGDSCRLYFQGLSEPQWTAVILTLVMGAAVFLRVLHVSPWLETGTALTVGFLFGATVIVTVRRPVDRELLGSGHVKEVAEALAWASTFPNTPEIPARYASRTSLGCRIATEYPVEEPNGCRYLLSRPGKPLSSRDAVSLVRLIRALNHPEMPYQLVRTGPGTYALTIQPEELVLTATSVSRRGLAASHKARE